MDKKILNTPISAGTYKTRDGHTAYVYEWGKNLLGKECWIGTVKDVGFGTWDPNGKDFSAYTPLDLIEKIT